MTWQPLSVREGRAKDKGPYEGVPSHLYEPLRQWVDDTFGGSGRTSRDNGARLAAALRYAVRPRSGQSLTVQELTASLAQRADVMLDVVDAVLYLLEGSSDERFPGDPWQQLDELLMLAGSVWQVDSRGLRCLVRRVDPTAATAFANASSPSDVTSTELGEAWTAAYGRNPDASDAWDHSIKAVETMLIPIVIPTNPKATLGVVIKTLNDRGHLWQLALKGHDKSASVAPLVSMLRLMWPNPDRHGGRGSRQPSIVEAQAVVQLAVTIAQWARSGILSKRPQ